MYALIENGSFVKWIVLSQDFPNTSFPVPTRPEDLPEGIVLVYPSTPPVVDKFKVVEPAASPVLKNGSWYTDYIVRDMTPSEKEYATTTKEREVRSIRNDKLTKSDWTQLPDTSVDHEAWAIYRQNLRDISSQPGFPFDIQWPQEPA